MASRLLLILLLVCGPWLPGCAAPVIIAAGAGTGYVMADDKSRRKVDRFFKDISRSVKQTTRRLTREQPRKKTTAPGKQGRFALRINKTGLHPARVHSGDTVVVTLQYTVNGGPAGGSQIEVKRRLLKDGKEPTVLNTETATRKNGTWEDTLTFAVPDSATPGRYAVVQQISARGVKRTIQRPFMVR